MSPPFRADHIGSLLRPQWLNEAKGIGADSHPDPDRIPASKQAEQRAIAEVVAEQLKRGVTSITSGEYEREIFYGGFFNLLSGLETREFDLSQLRPGLPTIRALRQTGVHSRSLKVASSKIRYGKSPYLEDWLYLRSLLPRDRWGQAKVTIPPPTWWHIQAPDGKSYQPGVYDSDEDYLSDVSVAVRQEILTLYEAGLRVVQIDDPNLTFLCDPEFVETSHKEGTDLEALLSLYVKAHNDVVRDLPDDLQVGIHLCRGNMPSGIHISYGGYENIAKTLFRECKYKFYCLEFDSPRAGSFEPLRDLPVGKAVMLGLITTKTAELEDVDVLKQRVHEAADVVAEGQGRTHEQALQDLGVSPQCGFSSWAKAGGKDMNMEVMWEKLDLVRRLADDIWSGE